MYFSLLMTSCCPVSPKHGLSIHFGVELLCCEKKKKKGLQLVVWSHLKLIVFYAPVSNVSASEPKASH